MASKAHSDLVKDDYLVGSIEDPRQDIIAKRLQETEGLSPIRASTIAFTAVRCMDMWLKHKGLRIVPEQPTEWMLKLGVAGQNLQDHLHGRATLEDTVRRGYGLAVKAAPVLRPPAKP